MSVHISVKVKSLGQTGYRFEFDELIIYIDPYLSNYVEEKEGREFSRLLPIPVDPTTIVDADWVLITHEHIDHCDPQTIIPISKSSPLCKFMGPEPVCQILESFGIDKSRLYLISDNEMEIRRDLYIRGIPAAHPEISRSANGYLKCIGYLIKYMGKTIYHSGDTSVDQEIIDSLKKEDGIDAAFISVNEKNYYRDAIGIIGNMSVREAFRLAEDISATKMIPMHWDMFEKNCVYEEEINLLYSKIEPKFELIMKPEVL
jgi:L-ascorbate metabolism protein UlaG (beta-lactamase superfamily)